MEATCYNGIHEPLWDDIFLSVGIEEWYLRPLSTMSKQFLSLSNRLRRTLTVTTSNDRHLPRLLKRFPNIKHINLPFFVDPATFFAEIDRFSIPLESLDMSLMRTFPIKRFKELPLAKLRATLRSLKFTYVEDQSDVDGDLEIISELFPNLEELDFFWSYNVTNIGVAKFSSKLKRLRRVTFAGNSSISDASVTALVENCDDLEDIALIQCLSISDNGLSFAFRHCRNLRSLVMKDMGDIIDDGSLALARNLSSLELYSMVVSDELLRRIARANLPLKRFSLSNSKGFSIQGFLPLLAAYHSVLESVAIENLSSKTKLKGDVVVYLAPYLWNVRRLKLNHCCALSVSQLIAMIHSCQKLESLEIKGTEICKDQDQVAPSDSDEKCSLISLNLSFSKTLTDQCLARVSQACPGLTQLFVNGCKAITHEGISQATRNCPGLRTIEMNMCEGVTTLAKDVMISKMELFEARGSGLDDKSLKVIAMKCPDLICLDVSNCSSVTALGVLEVVVRCNNLGKLGVSFKDVGSDFEYWLRTKKPWLVNRYV